jgi:hypothetical protein
VVDGAVLGGRRQTLRMAMLGPGQPRRDTEERRLVERYHRDAVRAGARLAPAEQHRLRAINAELSSLTTEFGNRLLAGAAAAAVHVTDPAQLDGLAPDARSAAALAARARGLDGHLLTLVLPPSSPPSPHSPTATCGNACTPRPSPGASAENTTPAPRSSRSLSSAPSGPTCSATRTTRRGSSRPRRPRRRR